MDIDKDIYHSNGMLGLIPVVDESEAMSFHFGKLLTSTTTTSDSKDFFNCDTSIGLEYPAVRSALQPICVHVDGAESTNWVNPPCDEHVDLLDISSKRLPVDLGFNNGLDKSSIYSSSINGSYSSSNSNTPNNHVILNSLPASEVASFEVPDYYGNNNQYNESYNSCIRNDYGNQHTPFGGEHEKIYYNGNQSLYSNGYHSQTYDHTNHHIHHVHHLANHQIYHNNNNHHHHHHQHQQPTTPLHYQQQKRGQQPFQRQYTHRRRLNLYEKTSPSPTKLKQKQQQHQQQQQPPVLAQKPPKPQKSPLIQRPQKPPKIQHQKSQPQPQPPPPPPPQQQSKPKPKPDQKQFFIKSKQRTHVKSESKPELNQRTVLKRKSGRPRKYDYSPPKPTKFRSSRLRLRVQSEDPNSEDAQDSGDTPVSERKVQEKVKKVKEVLPCDWVRPENLTFDRLNVSDYEKTSLPEFFAGKFDRTHFHPSQYLQIRNIFLDEWDKRKPNVVNFREMIRVHKGIGNVVSFSRVCKFLTAIGAINEISQDDDDEDNDDEVNGDDDVTKGSEGTIKEKESSTTVPDENQSKSQTEESEENEKEPTSTQLSPLSPSTLPTPPSSSPERQTNGLPLTQSDEKSCQPVTSSLPRRKGRKRKSYFLNEMSRLGIDPLSAGFRIPGYDKDRDKQDEDEDCEQTPANDDEDHNQSENEINPKLTSLSR